MDKPKTPPTLVNQSGVNPAGEIVISGVDTPPPAEGHTPTELHALWQGQLDTEHSYPEAEDEDG